MMFRVGQKVVCISEQHNKDYFTCEVPLLDCVYTVRDLDDDGIRLVEIRNRIMLTQNTITRALANLEPSFWQIDFRPIVERKTDISVFKRMLTPIGIDA